MTGMMHADGTLSALCQCLLCRYRGGRYMSAVKGVKFGYEHSAELARVLSLFRDMVNDAIRIYVLLKTSMEDSICATAYTGNS